jgi:hypothetical protein
MLGLLIYTLFYFASVVNDDLLLKEDIDIGYLFVGKVNLEEEVVLHLIKGRCKDNLIEL